MTKQSCSKLPRLRWKATTTDNYRTLITSDGIEAIAFYPKYATEIVVVLMDMIMPLLDGLSAIRTLQKINPLVKIIATSRLVSNSRPTVAVGAA